MAEPQASTISHELSHALQNIIATMALSLCRRSDGGEGEKDLCIQGIVNVPCVIVARDLEIPIKSTTYWIYTEYIIKCIQHHDLRCSQLVLRSKSCSENGKFLTM